MNFWMFRMTWIFVALSLWVATFTPSERVSLGAAFFVLIGVVGEYLVEINAVEKRRQLKEWLKRASMGLLVLGLSGDVLGIVMGQAEMAALTKQAGDAATSAHNAAGDATRAKSDAGEAKTKSEAADTTADGAVLKADTAREASFDALARAADVDKYADLIAFKVSWRMIDGKKFHELMAGKPIGTAEIWFEPDDEAHSFASQIAGVLKDAGWKVSTPEQVPADRIWDQKPLMTILDDLRLSASMNGLAIGSKHLPDLEGQTAAGAFAHALGSSAGRAFSYIRGEYPSLPDDHVVIVVGRHESYIPPVNPYTPKTEEMESTSPSKKNAKP